jgi:hypothetical protein
MQDLDPVLLFAFSDKSHSKDREAWRRFLELLLPVLLEIESSLISAVIDESSLDSLEDLQRSQHHTNETQSLLRSISSQLSSMLGLTSEFGMSCFLDDAPHTKVHAQSARSLRLSEDKILAGWLKRFKNRQSSSEASELFAQWKEKMEILLESEQMLEDAIASGHSQKKHLDAEDSEQDDWTKGTPVPRSA